MIWKKCMTAISNCRNMRQLKPIHAIFITSNFHSNTYAISKILTFCAISISGNLSYASLLFTQISEPNSYIYNTLIRAYSNSPQPHTALHYFNLMLNDDAGLVPDEHTFPFVLLACVNAGCFVLGGRIHSWVLKNGIVSSKSYVQTALLRFYVGFNVLGDARKVFDEIRVPDVVQWNVLMNGFVKWGFASEALGVYMMMVASGVEPDEYCVTTGLKACAQIGTLSQGKMIHDYMKTRKDLECDVFVGTALVHMYAKSGCMDIAYEIFMSMPKRSEFTWAAIIGGFALHGFAKKAIDCLEMQLKDGLRPDGVSILGVLTACTHAGLVEEGQSLLENMETKHGATPKHEHYSCVVDLLCKAGQLKKAFKLINKMPMKPLASVWGALLSGCKTYHNIELAEIAVKELLLIENSVGIHEDHGVYVQLSNIYLAAQKCEEARRVRILIGNRGIKKTPGCSMIEVDGIANEFVSGDVSHPSLAQIHEILDSISQNCVYNKFA